MTAGSCTMGSCDSIHQDGINVKIVSTLNRQLRCQEPEHLELCVNDAGHIERILAP